MVLEVILVVLGVVLVVLHGAQRQRSEQMLGTDGVRNNVPSQLRRVVVQGCPLEKAFANIVQVHVVAAMQ